MRRTINLSATFYTYRSFSWHPSTKPPIPIPYCCLKSLIASQQFWDTIKGYCQHLIYQNCLDPELESCSIPFVFGRDQLKSTRIKANDAYIFGALRFQHLRRPIRSQSHDHRLSKKKGKKTQFSILKCQ